jgi:hemerythrin superfamily protein
VLVFHDTLAKETRQMELRRILARMTAGDEHDALKGVRDDHTAVIALFDSYEDLIDVADRQMLVARILMELTIHARIEEELFYPTLRQAGADAGVMDQADVEHAMARALMRDLHGARAGASHYDAKVAVLAALVKHHIREEEEHMFELARHPDLDLSALGGQLDAYRAALRSRYELDVNGEELGSYLSARTVVNSPERKRTSGTGLNRMGRERRRRADGDGTPKTSRSDSRGVPTGGPRRPRRSRRSNRAAIGNS